MKLEKDLTYIPKINNEHLNNCLDEYFTGMKRIYVLMSALDMDVFGTLRNPLDKDAACDALGIEHHTGRLFLNSLVDMRLLKCVDGIYSNTQVTEDFLNPDSYMDLTPKFRFMTRNVPYWQNLTHILKEGQPVIEMAGLFKPEKLAPNMRTDAGGSIGRMMDVLEDHIDMENINSFLSIGASSSLYTIAVSMKHPNVKGYILDNERYAEFGKKLIEEYGTDTTMLSGDYHVGLQGSYDVVFSSLSHACMETSVTGQLADGVNEGGHLVVRRNSPEFSLDPLRDLDTNLTTLDTRKKGTIHHHGDEYGKEYVSELMKHGLYMIDRIPFTPISEIMVFKKGAE